MRKTTDAFAGTKPQVAFVILVASTAVYQIKNQALTGGDNGKGNVVVNGDPTAGANPQVVVVAWQQGGDVVVWQTLIGGPSGECLAVKTTQAVVGGQPQQAVVIGIHVIDEISGQSICS